MTSAVVFAYSEVGVRCVQTLLAQGIEIPLLFTHADDPGENQWFASVHELALKCGLRVETPANPNTQEWIAVASAMQPDFIFSFYYRHLLKTEWLSMPRLGALNMHGSLLPKYRGRAPVHWAILHGESQTGATLHYMLEKPDAGAIVDQLSVPILENDTALEVSLKVADAAREVLQRSLPRLIAGSAQPYALDLTQGSYFGRRSPEDGRIDWRQSARRVHDLVRAVAPPFPGAFTDIGGCRVSVITTQLDAKAVRYAQVAPCLYAEDGAWYADCVDGRRLKLSQIAISGQLVSTHKPPVSWAKLPVSLA